MPAGNFGRMQIHENKFFLMILAVALILNKISEIVLNNLYK